MVRSAPAALSSRGTLDGVPFRTFGRSHRRHQALYSLVLLLRCASIRRFSSSGVSFGRFIVSVILDASGTVLFANALAAEVLEARDGLEVRNAGSRRRRSKPNPPSRRLRQIASAAGPELDPRIRRAYRSNPLKAHPRHQNSQQLWDLTGLAAGCASARNWGVAGRTYPQGVLF
jgi:hypothetical protein